MRLWAEALMVPSSLAFRRTFLYRPGNSNSTEPLFQLRSPPHPTQPPNTFGPSSILSGQNSRASFNSLKKTQEPGHFPWTLSVPHIPHTPATQTYVEGAPLPQKQVDNCDSFSICNTFLYGALIALPEGPLPSPIPSLNGTILLFPSLPKCDSLGQI